MKEIFKLQEADLVYLVVESEWLSPIHVVPKKIGKIVVKNEKGVDVPVRVQNGWQMCEDFRKLNYVTKKDYFPIPFIDQML